MVLLLLAYTCSLLERVSALLEQDTLYDYDRRIMYIYLHTAGNTTDPSEELAQNVVFKIPFNSKLHSGDNISNFTIASPPHTSCEVVVAQSDLYSFCDGVKGVLAVNKYNPDSDSWRSVGLQSNLTFYNDSTYLYTNSDPTGIYIFSGVAATGHLSDEMLRLDMTSWQSSDASSRIQPAPFYKAASLQINSNTQAMFGGISFNGSLVSMMEIPLWQYNSWAERPCTTKTEQGIGSRIGSLALPVFYNTNQYLLNETLTTFDVSSVLVLGGEDLDENPVLPDIMLLNISTNVWTWKDLDDQMAASNTDISMNNTALSIDSIDAAAIIYDTLLTLTLNSSSTSRKRSTNDLTVAVQLYNATNLKYLDEMDYTYLNNINTQYVVIHSNKNTIIAISVIIPILVTIILAVFFFWLYKRYKAKKEEERNEQEIRDIVDFYENRHKQNSDLTFSSSDSGYKSGGTFDNYDFMKVNGCTGDDNLSIQSWRKKRREFEEQQYLFNKIKPNVLTKSSNSLMRSLSVASNYVSQSLSRQNSTQSTIATFVTAQSSVNTKASQHKLEKDHNTFSDGTINDSFDETTVINENPFESDLATIHSDIIPHTPIPTSPPPTVPKHSALVSFPNRTSSTLHHIPENSSVSTFHSQSLGFIPMKQAYYNTSPQYNYMKQLSPNNSHNSYEYSMYSGAPGSGSGSSNFASPSTYSSLNSSLTRSPRRPLSMVSSSIVSNIDFCDSECGKGYLSSKEQDNRDYQDLGSIAESDINTMEVQVLVGSKRRSKLRVVNPDTMDNTIENDNKAQVEGKNRCTSSSSEHSADNDIRKRVTSSEQHDNSFT